MNNYAVLALAVEIGYRLQESGAEIYRVEEAVRRIFLAYGIQSGQVFAIPNCLIVSAIDAEQRPICRLKRIPYHGTDIDRMERVYDYCRKVCASAPPVEQALDGLAKLEADHRVFPLWVQLAGYFVGAFGFSLFFGGTWLDAVAGGLCGVSIGLCLIFMTRFKTNLFFKTVAAAFVSALLAVALVQVGLGENASFITIGALMALVPGVVFTNFMRDIMAGDMVAGLIKLVEALLTGGAIAIGTLVAMAAANGLWGV